jgi:hypothetical protein
MIKGKRKKELTKEAILSKITSYDIYRYYQGPFKLNTILVNKHRGEKDPSLIIGNKLSSQLTHKDFGDGSWRGDCFSFVQQIHRCDFKMALALINRDLNLGLDGGKIEDKKVITWETPEITLKPPPLIQIVTRPMSKEEWAYWACYHQGEEDIVRENIYVPSQIWRNKKRMVLGDLMTFCYYYPDVDKWKIYRPFAPKREKDTPSHMWKWDTNLPFDYIEDLPSIEGADLGVLGKSKKDRMVLRKALEIETIANVQAEDPACMSREALNVFDTARRKLVVSDNDKKGKEFSWWLTDNYGFRHCNVPDRYHTEDPKCTDFADLACVHGLDKVKNHFKLKRFI